MGVWWERIYTLSSQQAYAVKAMQIEGGHSVVGDEDPLLEEWHAIAGDDDAGGLPDVIVAQVSQPARDEDDVGSLGEYLEQATIQIKAMDMFADLELKPQTAAG